MIFKHASHVQFRAHLSLIAHSKLRLNYFLQSQIRQESFEIVPEVFQK